MALGFTSMGMLGVQFILTARFRRATAPFGIDIIYYFHRYLAIVATGFIGLHYLIIRIKTPEVLALFNPVIAPWYMTLGRIALLLFVIIIITSLLRKQLKIRYESWRLLHIVLTISAFLLAVAHITGVGYYIDTAVKRYLWISYTLSWFMLIVYIRVAKPWQLYKKPYRVVAVEQECCNSWTLTLAPDGHAGLQFKPGQFAWLTLRSSPWRVREHPFSISSSALKPKRVDFSIKELGDFTRTIKDITVGETAYVDGPYGAFSVDRYPQAPGFVFIAGGVGVAPIIGMLRTLADRREKRPLWFIYSNNRVQEIMFAGALEQLKQRLNLQLVHVLKQPPENWHGEDGLVTAELMQRVLPEDLTVYEYFLCGPKAMSESVQSDLNRLKVKRKQIHFELFDMV